jgi:hypothetical protein
MNFQKKSINGNEIVMDYTEVPIGDVIEVTYRYTIESPNEIIRKSVRVYDKPFSDPTSKLLLEGTDYTLNGSNGLIRRLSTGGIAANGSVHVSFDFKNAELGTERFYTWCRIDDPAGVEIRFDLDDNLKKNRLQVDNEFNEKYKQYKLSKIYIHLFKIFLCLCYHYLLYFCFVSILYILLLFQHAFLLPILGVHNILY